MFCLDYDFLCQGSELVFVWGLGQENLVFGGIGLEEITKSSGGGDTLRSQGSSSSQSSLSNVSVVAMLDEMN